MEETMTPTDEIRKVAELIKGIKFAMMTTVSDDGRLYSRPMTTQDTDFAGDVWFFTADDSEKVRDLHNTPQVNLAYAKSDSSAYVSMSGRAELVRDRAKIEELWNPLYKAYFPDGLDDPKLALIHVTAQSAEYWDSPSSPVVRLLGMAKAALTGSRDQQGENATVDLSGASRR
jgi:general stress protein 26